MSDTCSIREYLADRDAPCPRCGYNVRGTIKPVCTECGHMLVVKELLTQPRVARKQMIFLIVYNSLFALPGLMWLLASLTQWGWWGMFRALFALSLVFFSPQAFRPLE